MVATILAVVATWWQPGLPRVVFSSEILALHARIDAEAFNRDTRLLVSTRPWWSANPLGMLWPEMDAALATSGGGNGGPPAAARRSVGRSSSLLHPRSKALHTETLPR